MPTNLTQEFIKVFLGRETGDAAIILLEMTHPSIGTPLRLALNTQPVVHQAQQYEPMYFECSFPEQQPDKVGGVKLRVDGVDRTLIERIRSFQTPPMIRLKVVATVDLDAVQVETAEMAWRLVTYGSHWIEGDIEPPGIYNLNFPGNFFTPSVAPGLFREF